MKAAAKATRRKAAGREARRLLRAEKKNALRRYWKQLSLAVIGVWTLIFLVALVPQPPFARGMVIGLGLGATPLLWREFLIARGITAREMGAVAEEWTAQELGKLDSSRWFVLHDLPGPHGNVDHIAIGPSRVHVIETKWTSGAPTNPALLASAARQAETAAKTIRTHLAAQGVVDREVLPIVVVWGPKGAATAEEPFRAGVETTVVMGAHARTWRERMQQADGGSRSDRVALEALATPLPQANGAWTSASPLPPSRSRVEGRDESAVLELVEWKRYGKHRFYANVDGRDESVGWIDVPSGQLHVEEDAPTNTARDLTRARERLLAGERISG